MILAVAFKAWLRATAMGFGIKAGEKLALIGPWIVPATKHCDACRSF
jgi:hypothetical protein